MRECRFKRVNWVSKLAVVWPVGILWYFQQRGYIKYAAYRTQIMTDTLTKLPFS